MSTTFTVTVTLEDPFDVVPEDQVQAAVETALKRPETGLLGMNVQVSTHKTVTKEYTRSEAWSYLVTRGKGPDSTNDFLNGIEYFKTPRTADLDREYVQIGYTERGKFTIKVLGGGD